ENRVFENGSKTNNSSEPAHPFDVMPLPYADLAVSSVTADATANSGGTLRVNWTVTNQGIGVTDTSTWFDTLSLVSAAGTPVATYFFQHLGNLAPNGNYARAADLALPNGISGVFHVVVTTGGPYEFIFTNNDTGTSSDI